MKKRGLITISIIATLVLIVAGVGFYKFNFTDDDIFFEGKGIKPENYKTFTGSWVEESNDVANQLPIGFALNADGSASSINSATLIYKRWRIVNDQLLLTSISLGNHLLSVDNDSLQITSYNDKKLFLKRGTQNFCFVKSDKKSDKENLQNITFKYCPVNIENIHSISPTHSAIDWKSNVRGEKFRSTITQLYAKGKANFAGYYQVMTWGCGSSCQEGVMIDTRNGKIYDLPTLKGYQDIGSGTEQQFGSILLITYNSLKNPNTQKEERNNHYWLWNENSKEFIRYK